MSRPIATVAVGDRVGPLARIVTREDISAYAEIGGDHNPLHQDDAFARAAGFPSVIAHGMFTMGHLATCVATWAGAPADVLELSAQFRAPVFPGEEIVAAGRVRTVDAIGGAAILELWVTVERDEAIVYPIRKGEAAVRLAP